MFVELGDINMFIKYVLPLIAIIAAVNLLTIYFSYQNSKNEIKTGPNTDSHKGS